MHSSGAAVGMLFLLLFRFRTAGLCGLFFFSDLQCNLHEDAMLAFVNDVCSTKCCCCISMWMDVAASYSADLGFGTEKKTFPGDPTYTHSFL